MLNNILTALMWSGIFGLVNLYLQRRLWIFFNRTTLAVKMATLAGGAATMLALRTANGLALSSVGTEWGGLLFVLYSVITAFIMWLYYALVPGDEFKLNYSSDQRMKDVIEASLTEQHFLRIGFEFPGFIVEPFFPEYEVAFMFKDLNKDEVTITVRLRDR